MSDNLNKALTAYEIKFFMVSGEVLVETLFLACIDGFLLRLWEEPCYLLVDPRGDVTAIATNKISHIVTYEIQK